MLALLYRFHQQSLTEFFNSPPVPSLPLAAHVKPALAPCSPVCRKTGRRMASPPPLQRPLCESATLQRHAAARIDNGNAGGSRASLDLSVQRSRGLSRGRQRQEQPITVAAHPPAASVATAHALTTGLRLRRCRGESAAWNGRGLVRSTLTIWHCPVPDLFP